MYERTGRRIDFKPSGNSMVFKVRRAVFHDGVVCLSEHSIRKGATVAAYLCRDYEKIIIDYTDNKSDHNRR